MPKGWGVNAKLNFRNSKLNFKNAKLNFVNAKLNVCTYTFLLKTVKI